jgi:transcriptional regulator with PAS, ATPase and Fis domain
MLSTVRRGEPRPMTQSDRQDLTLTLVRRDAVQLPSVRVTVTCPGGEVVEASLGMEPLVVGTSAECDLVLADARVSRRHCELTLGESGVLVRDLGSKNGTFVMGVQIVEAVLPPAANATVGSSTLHVRVVGAPSILQLSPSASFGEAIGASLIMRALFAKLERAAVTPETVLLLGESGTGKELLARAVHDASPRRAGPFVVLDCSAVAPNLIESELFGYVRGAFTGAINNHTGMLEQANGGTVFLDELGELPLELQPKLLRALEARQVKRVGTNDWRSFDARVIAATHRDLRARVTSGAFREDLYYRLAVVEAVVPPLRDRKDDIPLLVERFLAAQTPACTIADLPPNAMEMLRAHSWPGNVRELRNTVARLILFPHMGEEAIDQLAAARTGGSEGLGAVLKLPLREAREAVVEQFERSYLSAKLREHAGNVSRAAESMQVSRQFLHRLLDRYGIRRE